MKSFKYTINGNVYKVHINSVVDDIADVEVNGTPYQVKLEKPAKKQMVTLKRPAQAPTTASGDPVVTRPAASTTQGAVKTPLPGVILQVKCNVGDTVKRGHTLIEAVQYRPLLINTYLKTCVLERDITDQDTKSDRDQKHRFKLIFNRQEYKQQTYQNHDEMSRSSVVYTCIGKEQL